MKKMHVVILIAIILVVGAYLFGANAYIYHRIHQGNLVAPDTTHHYEISGPEGGAPLVYAALGDSLTAGIGADTYEQSYPYRLAQKLAVRNAINLEVFAYPGLKSDELVANYLSRAIQAKPDIVTVLIGTNDIHNWVSSAEFEKNYRTLLVALSKTNAKVYAVSIPYIGSNSLHLFPLNYYFDHEIAKFNAIVERLAAEYGATYVDIATPTKSLLKKDGPLYSRDSFHPSALGYSAWSTILYANINF